MEGILEQKGEATDHCWQLSRFRLDSGLGTLDAYGIEDDEFEGPLQGRVWLRDVANLKLQGAKCTLEQVNGKKIRLRSETPEEANAWFQAITEAASVAAAEAEAKAAEAEAAAAESASAGEVFDEDWAGAEPDPEEDGQFEDELEDLEQEPEEQLDDFHQQPLLQQPAALRPHSSSGGSSAGGVRRAPMVDVRTRGRLQELYESHGIKTKKFEERKRQQDKEEVERLDAMRPKVRGVTASSVSQRLYGEHMEARNRKMEMQQQFEEKKQMELQEEMRKARPTRSSSTGQIVNPRETCQRLHGDAERRERERREMREAADIAELERLREQAVPKICSSSAGSGAGVSAHRHNDLYADAQARKERMELKREQAEEQERQRLASFSVMSGTASNPNRFVELHQEYAERQRRRQAAAAERQLKESEDIKRDAARTARRTGSSAGNGGRPSGPTLRGLASLSAGGSVTARRVSSPKGLRPAHREEAPAGQAPLSARQPRARSPSAPPQAHSPTAAPTPAAAPAPSTQADCALEAVGRALMVRGVFEGKSTLSQDLKPLAAPLRAATAIFRDAQTSLLAGEGYSTLCALPSQRLYGEHLMPESEGWARGFEPDPVRQVEEDLVDLLASASAAHSTLKDIIAPGGVYWAHGLLDTRPEGVPAASMAYDPGPKTEAAARAKAVARYGCAEGREKACRHLTDLARVCVVFETCELLLAGVQQILHQFETVGLRNYFASPGPIGVRYIEILVVVPVGPEGMPHVCEVRLEHAAFFGAQRKAAPHLERFFQAVDQASRAARKDEMAVAAVVRAALVKPPPNHALRVFRCQLAKRFGSAACCWRRSALGGSGSGRIARFEKFREVCQALKCVEQTVPLWEGLDCALAGCISLFELDPEALVLLLRARHVLSSNEGMHGCVGVPLDAEATFARLSKMAKPVKAGYLQEHEFRIGALRLGLCREEADRVFDYLDYCGGSHHAPPATITTADIAWLLRLPQLVDGSSVSLMAPYSESGGEEEDFGDFMDNRSRRSAWSTSTSSSGRTSSATPVTSRCPRRIQVLGRGARSEGALRRSGSEGSLNPAPPSLRLEPGHTSEVSDSEKDGGRSPRRLSDASTTASAVQMAMANIPAKMTPSAAIAGIMAGADRERERPEEKDDMQLLLEEARDSGSEREHALAFSLEESY